MEYATARLAAQMPIQDQTITGGPPDSTPMMRTPERADQHVTMLKEKATMPMREKSRLSSGW
jgi:hypothetical protein